MSVTVQDFSPQIIAKKKQATSLGLRLIADAIVREATPNTPRRRGELRGRVLRQVLGTKGRIEWQAKHAVYQERGYSSGPIRNYTTPGTGAHFARNAVATVAPKGKQFFRQAGL